MSRGTEFLDKRAEELRIRSDVDWSKWLNPAEQAKVRDASTYQDTVKDAFLNPETARGLRLPWRKADEFRFRSGELTLWTGYNGHKKSMMLGQVILGLMAQNAVACIASLEMKPVKSLKRMARQFVGADEPTLPAIDDFLDWCKGKLWFYDQVGTVKAERMIAVARYAISELGVNHFVIDSLMKCGIGEEDYDKQKWFIDQLSSLAGDTGAHLHLVAHAKKPQDGREIVPSTKYSVKGSGSLVDMPDNVLIVYWNKNTDETRYNALLICEKQREGEDEPRYSLHFDERCIQFKGGITAQKLSPGDWRCCAWQ